MRRYKYYKKDKLEYWLGVAWGIISGGILVAIIIANIINNN